MRRLFGAQMASLGQVNGWHMPNKPICQVCLHKPVTSSQRWQAAPLGDALGVPPWRVQPANHWHLRGDFTLVPSMVQSPQGPHSSLNWRESLPQSCGQALFAFLLHPPSLLVWAISAPRSYPQLTTSDEIGRNWLEVQAQVPGPAGMAGNSATLLCCGALGAAGHGSCLWGGKVLLGPRWPSPKQGAGSKHSACADWDCRPCAGWSGL